jgi:UDP-glucose 4-epimerase
MQVSEWAGRKVLVTGGTGFLGSHLCRKLIELGAELHSSSRTPMEGNHRGLQHWPADLAEVETAKQLLTTIRPDIIFHLTSHGVGAPDLQHLLPTVRNDLTPTVNILAIATELRVGRIVLAASLEEPQPGQPTGPGSPYAAAKWAGSIYAEMCHRLYDTPFVTVRPYMAYGPGQKKFKVIPYVTLSLLQGKVPKLSSGRRPVDWIYVDDVIEGMIKAATAPGVEGCSIDLGSGQLVTIGDVVAKLVELTGARVEPEFGALSDRPIETVRVADLAYAFEKLQWQPAIPLETGLERTVKWYRKELAAARVD